MADAAAFSRMAERVRVVDEEEFAGAAVIVPPGEAKPIEFVTSDPNPDLIQFWASVKSRVEIAYAEAVAKADQARSGGVW